MSPAQGAGAGAGTDDWDGIEGVDGWRSKLRALLDEAALLAVQGADPLARMAMSERLTRFVEHSFPNTGPIRTLDEIATRAAIGLLEQNIDERLKSIVTRNLELAALTKQLEAGTDAARESAASIRLARATRTLGALSETVGTMRELRLSLKGASDRELLASIDKATTAVQTLRALIERTHSA
jgi:outer membrane murein-binding lipoprotein Lpp